MAFLKFVVVVPFAVKLHRGLIAIPEQLWVGDLFLCVAAGMDCCKQHCC